jgi:phosphoribosylaminoimidazole-succinocarboxamide synthase
MMIMRNKFLVPGYKPFRKGKVREFYWIPNERKAISLCVTTDQISAFNKVIGKIKNKGIILNSISNFWKVYFQGFIENDIYTIDGKDALQKFNILEDPSDLFKRSILVWNIKPLPFEFIVRGYMTGGFFEEYKKNNCEDGQYLFDHPLPGGLKEAEELPRPIFTPSSKVEHGDDVNIGFWDVANKIGYARAERIKATSIALYLMAHKYLLKRGIILADTKFEFGLFIDSHGNEHLYLIDEVLTPDSSRFWSLVRYSPGSTQESYDKQPFRDYLRKKNWDGISKPPRITQSVGKKTLTRYEEIERIIFSKPIVPSLQVTGHQEIYARTV